MSAAASLPHRVVAVFDPYAPDPSVLRLALRLGLPGRSVLHALYIEESDALLLGSLPWAQEVALATAQAHPIRAAAVARDLEQRAAAARALFESATSGLAGARFELARGRLVAELARVAADASAVLLGWPPVTRRSRTWARNILNALLELPSPIVGLVASVPPAPGMLVVQAGAGLGPIREAALRLAAPSAARVAVQRWPASAAQVMQRLQRELLGTLLIERDLLDAGDGFLGELALRWSGSLLLLR